MKIKQIFNNNVILSENRNKVDVVVMGKGLAFQKIVGDEVEQSKIEKSFLEQLF